LRFVRKIGPWLPFWHDIDDDDRTNEIAKILSNALENHGELKEGYHNLAVPVFFAGIQQYLW